MANISRNTTQHIVAATAVTTAAGREWCAAQAKNVAANQRPVDLARAVRRDLTGYPLAKLEQEGCYGVSPGEVFMASCFVDPFVKNGKGLGKYRCISTCRRSSARQVGL